MRSLLNASLLPKVLISLCTCVEVVPVEVQECVEGSVEYLRVQRQGESWMNDAEVFRRDSENVKLFQRCEFGFGDVLGGSDIGWMMGWLFGESHG
jgi:hypothetical protein